ncbi:hypothetical protein BC332_07675 [Capsicum chinense]|nr:hypothetical protein BC332_07675 [Capsicum chinense]
MADEDDDLLDKKVLVRSASHMYDELSSFRTWFKWMCVDQSEPRSACLSWFVFSLLGVGVPWLSHYLLACNNCDADHSRTYDSVVQFSLSSVAALSFICLSRFNKKYGLRRFLFLDKLCDESETVRNCYTQQLNRSMKILFIFLMPCFIAETTYKIWWYSSGGTQIPYLGNVFMSNTILCILELTSWLYRTVVFFLVCVLFRLICYLQILRLQDFAQVLVHVHSSVESMLREHLRIRRHLRIISHRFRVFILWVLIFITASLFASLLLTTSANADLRIYKSGELALSSVSFLAGLMILLRSATKITHKAQAVTCLAAKWHACATIESYHWAETEIPPATNQVDCNNHFLLSYNGSSDAEDVGDEEDELDNTKFVPCYANRTISFQKRQALVTYFENNRAGVTIYGFMLDRTSLHTIFGIELTLILWLLGKTVGVS